jgi:3-phenylpropionate/trans-cinnamate dioxygenase ferredoxin component
MTFVRACSAGDVPVGESRGFVVDGAEIALANLGDAGFRALGDVCSHAHAYLHEGDVDLDDETIECPLHGSTFDLNDGHPTTLPATQPVPSYPVRRDDNDDILIEVTR